MCCGGESQNLELNRMLYYSHMNHVALAVSNTNTLMLTIADGHRVKTSRHYAWSTHHSRRHFDLSTWVVSANSQFATVQCVSLSFSVFRRSCWPISTTWVTLRLSTQGCAFWGSVNIAFHLGRYTNICRPKLTFTTGKIRVLSQSCKMFKLFKIKSSPSI